jgi:hypothetical protein
MKALSFVLCLVVGLCALPVLAQDIPAGDDVWDSLGGGATDVTLSSADWFALCGVTVPDTALQLKGYNIAGYGTGDTVVTRLDPASFANGNTVTVRIQLKRLSFVNDGPHPCSPLTIRVTEDTSVTQLIDKMTITRNSASGGAFSANVPVKAVINALDSNGNVVGTTYVGGILGDASTSPWSYQPPTGGVTGKAWYPGVDPVTQQPVRVCRRGNKTLPAKHCYQPPPKCPAPKPVQPVGTASADAISIEPCTTTVEPLPDVE